MDKDEDMSRGITMPSYPVFDGAGHFYIAWEVQ